MLASTPGGERTGARAFTDEVLRAAALRAEAALCHIRSTFCLLVALRFVWIMAHEHEPAQAARAAIMLPATAAGLLGSCWIAARLKRGRIPSRLIQASVLFDALVCFVVISSNVLHPFPEYRGVLLLPESASFLAMLIAAGFRVTLSAAALGTVANGVGLSSLVVLDFALNAERLEYRAQHILLYAILLGCTAALTLAVAQRTRRLVTESATKTWRVDCAERGLQGILQEHHDAATVLTAAMFSARKLRGAVADPAALDELSRDLAALQFAVEEIRDRAYDESLTVDEPVEVDVEHALDASKDVVERAAEPTRVEWHVEAVSARVCLPGGARALRRMLLNLVMNAKQGNGRQGARHARIRVTRVGDTVHLAVEDDGPGIALSAVPGLSSKQEGTGSGLRFVRSLVAAAGGELSFVRLEPAGTRVQLRLPLA